MGVSHSNKFCQKCPKTAKTRILTHFAAIFLQKWTESWLKMKGVRRLNLDLGTVFRDGQRLTGWIWTPGLSRERHFVRVSFSLSPESWLTPSVLIHTGWWYPTMYGGGVDCTGSKGTRKRQNTVESHYNGPASNGRPPRTETSLFKQRCVWSKGLR